MQFHISTNPSSHLLVIFEPHEQLITEKGVFISADGEYSFKNKLEINSYKSWIASIIEDKSLAYNLYTAQEPLQMILAPNDNAEILQIDISHENPIIFEPNLHFARTPALELKLKRNDWKSTLNDGLKLQTEGDGTLLLKTYGKVIVQEIDREKPIYIDENALVAFEATVTVKTITKSLKEMLTSGEGLLYALSGKGKIWLQTRKPNTKIGGGIIGSVLNWL